MLAFRSFALRSFTIALAATGTLGAQRPQTPARPAATPLKFEFLGPTGGGRVAAVTGVPGDPKTWYLGSASGGVWKSSDSGSSFVPVFDSMRVQAIGALAVAPSKPNIVWAGTGEAWAIRDADVMGDGIYKSTDAGKTWTNMGLHETGRIGRIIVHPTNPNIVYVCALGRVTGPQEEHGVYRTTDGGATWKHVLGLGGNFGCSGLALDAKNPRVLFAGMWGVIMHTWAMFSGTDDPKAGIYVSRDGGDTWTQVKDPGLPKPPIGKIDVAVAPSNSKRVYALIQTADQGSLWRSDDGGRKWKIASWARPLIGRAGYYIRLAVSPKDENEVLVANSSFYRSKDGGKTFEVVPWGGDNHDIWYDPKNADHFGLTNDLSARITFNHGKSFTNVVLPNGQNYHVAVDSQTPYWIYTNRQDNGTMRGPSDSPEAPQGARPGAQQRRDSTRRDSTGRRSANPQRVAADSGKRAVVSDSAAQTEGAAFDPNPRREWEHGLGGCESGFTLPDLADPNIVWASCYGNEVTRYDARTKLARSVSPWIHTLDSPPNETKYRCHWTPPLAIDPFDSKTVYYGCQVIFKTSNEGQHWDVISPDLSTRDSSRIVSSGGIVGDNLGQFYGEVVFAIAPSQIQRGLIWAGTNDGKVWYTKDGGANWVDVSKNMNAPAWGTVRKIEPSHFDPATAYVAVDFHMMDDRAPYLYKTTDFGQTWTKITGDLPNAHPLDYVMSVAENPNKRAMLFAGTGHGFFYSKDDGAHWTPFTEGLPAAPVTWIETPAKWHDVVVSTYGRGIYILRDIGALEESDAPKTVAQATLFTPRVGYRTSRSGRTEFTFTSPRAARATLEVLDSTGTVVRTIQSPVRAGLNRVSWNLRYDAAPQVALRTAAPDNPRIWDEPRFKGKNTRPILHWGIENTVRTGPIAAPGRYSVRLTLGPARRDSAGSQSAGDGNGPPAAVNREPLTKSFSVVRDPAMSASDADLAASTAMQVKIRDDIKVAVEMLNKLEVMRKSIEDQLKANAGKSDVEQSLRSLDKQMFDVEMRLATRSDLDSDDKYYVEPMKVYMALIWLSGEVGSGAGDVAGAADSRPTDASVAVLAGIERDLDAARAAYKHLMDDVVPEFNRTMAGKVPTIAF